MKKISVFACLSLVVYTWCVLSFDWCSIIVTIIWTLRLLYTKNRLIIMVSLGMFVVAMTRVYFINQHSRLDKTQTNFELMVYGQSIKVNGDMITGEGVIDNEHVSFQYKCQNEDDQHFFQQLETDIIVRVNGQLKPYKTTSFMTLFNEKDYYFQYKRSFYKLEMTQYQLKHTQLNIVLKWQKNISYTIKGHLWQYVNAFVFGQVDEKDYFESFQQLGVLFLFVFSGFHIKVILHFLNDVLLRLGILRHYTTAIMWGLSILCLTLYDFKIGVIKQVVFFLFSKQSRLFLLSLLIIGLVLYNPFFIYHVAFHFSIVVSVMYYFVPKKLTFYGMLVLFTSYHYFQLNIIGLFLTSIISFVVKWLLLPIAWLAALCPHPLLNRVNLLLDVIHQCIVQLSQLKWGIIITGRQDIYWYVIYIVCLVFLIIKSYKKRHVILYLLLILSLYPKPANRFIMLDVGQGDSLVFQSGYHVVMVDTGGNLSFKPKEKWRQRKQHFISDFNTLPLLRSLGIGKIDAIICSHADMDHVGELKHLQEKFEVQQIISAKGEFLLNSTRKVLVNDVITVGDMRFDVLYPFKMGDGKNEHSVVLYTTFLNKNWLLTGDVGKESEQQIIKRYAKLPVDILKVGHHGSHYSSTPSFLQHIHAQIALISVGENNRYHHPHDDVLKRLSPMTIYRTDKQGTVLFDGEKWEVGKR